VTPETVAIVERADGRAPAELVWHNPSVGEQTHSLPGVQAFSYHPLTGPDGQRPSGPIAPEAGESELRRPIVRGLRRLRTLQEFLGSERLSVGGGVFCERISSSPPNVSVFAPARVDRRTYHVHLKSVDSLPPASAIFTDVNLVTGCCLFSDRALRVTGVGGETFQCLGPGPPAITAPVRAISCGPRLSLYELEAACRLPRFVAEVLAMLPERVSTSVTLDVPRVQYYLCLLDAFYEGLVAPELMLRWFDLVDQRSHALAQLFHQQLADALSMMELDGRAVVRTTANMDCLEPAVRDSVRSGAPVEVDQMAAVLAADDPIWAIAFSAVTPSSFRELINLSYVIEQLRSGGIGHDDGRSLGIAVDSWDETQMFEATRSIAGQLDRAGLAGGGSLLGLYPLERVFTSAATGRTDLYHHDPGGAFVDASRRQYDAAELLANLYPEVGVLEPVADRARRRVPHGSHAPAGVNHGSAAVVSWSRQM
jgi:hypothetical protein